MDILYISPWRIRRVTNKKIRLYTNAIRSTRNLRGDKARQVVQLSATRHGSIATFSVSTESFAVLQKDCLHARKRDRNPRSSGTVSSVIGSSLSTFRNNLSVRS